MSEFSTWDAPAIPDFEVGEDDDPASDDIHVPPWDREGWTGHCSDVPPHILALGRPGLP